MTHYCVCGHRPADHHLDFGRCEADYDDGNVCTCPHYEKDTDD